MAFRVQVVSDSISPSGSRLASILMSFPREILPEVLTHTILSKNTTSSRAIPFPTMLKQLLGDPAAGLAPDLYVPPHFGANQKGMQAKAEVSESDRIEAERIWRAAAMDAIRNAGELYKLGVHKQVVNRIIEPYTWTTQLLTGTQWANFFALRTDEDAHPAFQIVAKAAFVAMKRSVPKRLDYHEWHLPFIVKADRFTASAVLSGNHGSRIRDESFDVIRSVFNSGIHANQVDQLLCVWSSARCARLTFRLFDGKPTTPADELATWAKLNGRLKHASPLGHQAAPLHPALEAQRPDLKSNLSGWLQFRKLVPNECVRNFDPSPETVASWNVDETTICESQEE